MSTKTITLRGPEARTAETTLRCLACGATIRPGDTYALFPAFAPGMSPIMAPCCAAHGWAAKDETRMPDPEIPGTETPE